MRIDKAVELGSELKPLQNPKNLETRPPTLNPKPLDISKKAETPNSKALFVPFNTLQEPL